MKRIFFLVISILFFLSESTFAVSPVENTGWKAGVSKTVITPSQNMWMAGFGFRDKPSEGAVHDLLAKALVLEDVAGNRSVLVTSDLLGFPKGMSDHIRDRIEAKYNLSRSQIILNSSHTHTGPVLRDALYDIYPLQSEDIKRIEEYSAWLEDKVVDLVGEAIKAIKPAKVYAGQGSVRFQYNRRNNNASLLNRLTELEGPNDFAVPVIKVENENGQIMAVTFGYACHPVVLSSYEWSGDYPGFAQRELEKKYPGATAMFFQGAGGDQNPYLRHTVEVAQQYGKELAASVDRILTEDMKELSPRLKTAYSEVELSLSTPPSADDLSKMAARTSGYPKRWAERIVREINSGKTQIESYPYPVQVWQLGDQVIFSLGGELVIEYSVELRRIFGQDIFVMGYSNDVMGYIPSVRILREGGYEGATAQMVYGLPSTWRADIENRIMDEVLKVAGQCQIQLPESKLVSAP
ncbi:MAG: neutral/alkaline non-lysosomal ceramidase N-terminal domain-containing protein [Prolixibacteraceae bacterium]|nr:neutral/alkaline non-lysosomal ceramidase N-terminal domain-containing protein [Prolixibacteraceae bacterium]